MAHAGGVADKHSLRAGIRQQRRSEDPVAQRNRSRLLLAAAPVLAPLASAGVAGFQPTNHEPDISPLLRELAAAAPVYLPRVTGGSLEWVRASAGQLMGGLTGIPRPAGATAASGAAVVEQLGVSLMLVPALAVDPATGARLGYGAGFYDRLLAQVADRSTVLVVGVCRAADLLALPVDGHDQPVDAVLTESGLQYCTGR